MKRTVVFSPVSCVLVSAFIAGGCTVTQTAFVQDIEVTGTIHMPPVRVAAHPRAGQFQITGGFAQASNVDYQAEVPGHTKVDSRGIYQVDTIATGPNAYVLHETPGVNRYPFRGQNFRWDPTPMTMWMDFQLMASNVVALTGGFAMGSSKGKSFWDWRVGLGFVGNGEDVGVRLDAGIQTGELQYTASTVVTTRVEGPFTPAQESVVIFRDEGRNTFVDFYGSLSFNTKFRFMPVQFLLNAAITQHTLYDYSPHTLDPLLAAMFLTIVDANVAATHNTSTFWILSPGVYFELNEQMRIVLGARYAQSADLDNPSHPGFWIPFGQVEIAF